MTTLISAHNSEGCYGRCDAKCYNALGPDCDCICGGSNHGAGLDKALENTRQNFQDFIDNYNKVHQDQQLNFDVPANNAVQLGLL